jgi:hypothetical protein
VSEKLTPCIASEVATGGGLPLREAARRFPSSRRGRALTLSCVLRWISRGVPGPYGNRVRLEAVRLAGKWLTSEPAIARFLAAQTPSAEPCAQPTPRTPGRRQQASERAARELEALGI